MTPNLNEMDIQRMSNSQLGLLRKAVKEYYSGVDLLIISKRYGFSSLKINSVIELYSSGNFSIFGEAKNSKLQKAMESLVKEMEYSLKMANIKIEGSEFMTTLLKKEYGIDLPQKARFICRALDYF